MTYRPLRRAAQMFCALAASLVLVAGCRQILSIEERTFDDSLDDPDPLSCEAYCELIQSVCVGNNLQFSSTDACIGLCSTYPEGTLDDESGNTLGCRIHVLESSQAMIESSDCAAAGPGGDGVCGTNCDSFCTSMLSVCPQSFESKGDCLTVCDPLADCGAYSVDPNTTPDDPSIQCRLFHISAAAVDLLAATPGELTSSQNNHCPHASGATECIPVDGYQCP